MPQKREHDPANPERLKDRHDHQHDGAYVQAVTTAGEGAERAAEAVWST
jgi:hypothetical protein